MCLSARQAALALLDARDPSVVRTLEKFGAAALRFAAASGIRIALLNAGERYDERSSALRRLGIDVDAWPAPPAGLFVVEERTVYLRSRSTMTVAHEFGHALGCALGGGAYLSGIDARLKELFSRARSFVTPYAASGADEYFAECMRAYVEANDAASVWPRATRARLQRIDPQMFAYLDRLLGSSGDLRGGHAARVVAPRRPDVRNDGSDVTVA